MILCSPESCKKTKCGTAPVMRYVTPDWYLPVLVLCVLAICVYACILIYELMYPPATQRDERKCAVCLDELKMTSLSIFVACRHAFCSTCCKRLRQQPQKTCPICRRPGPIMNVLVP